MTPRTKAHLALLAANLIYGANFTIAKHVMPRLIPAYGFIFLRVLGSVVLFWMLWLMDPGPVRIDRKDYGRFVLCGITGITINQMMFFKGLSLTLPIHASLMQLTSPILITLIAAFLIGERLTWIKGLGLLLGITGAVLLVTMGKDVGGGPSTRLGDTLIFINALSYATYLVLVKPLMQKYPPLTVIRWVFTFGLPIVSVFCWKDFTLIRWHAFQPGDWLATAFVVVCTTFLAYFFNAYALGNLRASTVGAYIYLQPLFAALIAISFYGERLSTLKLLAAGAIFGGVYLVGYKKGRFEGWRRRWLGTRPETS